MRNLDEIRTAYENGEGSLKELAQRFDTPYSTLTRRCLGEQWRKPRVIRKKAQMSVHAFAYVHGFWLTREQITELANRAQAMCLAQDIQRGVKDDDRFGLAYTYPLGILSRIFAEQKLGASSDSAERGGRP